VRVGDDYGNIMEENDDFPLFFLPCLGVIKMMVIEERAERISSQYSTGLCVREEEMGLMMKIHLFYNCLTFFFLSF
jgi:hypothetical protein